MTQESESAHEEIDLEHLLKALDDETLQILAELKDAAPGAAEWTISTLPLGSRAAMHAYGAIRIGEVIDTSMAEDPDTLRLRHVELLPLGERAIEEAAARIGGDPARTVKRLVGEALAS